MPGSLADKIAHPQNVLWAWFKVKNALRYADTWVDELAIWEFELHLDVNVQSISRSLADGTFRLDPVKPLPQLKELEEGGRASVREYFWISIKDQVAWVSVVNVIGEIFERKMPGWSYGNRIHRKVWIDRDQTPARRRFGPFRKSSAHVYRRFPQMWSLYRRHAYLTIRAMAGQNFAYLFALDDQSEEIQNLEERPVETQAPGEQDKSAEPLAYLSATHWRGKVSPDDPAIWYAYVDLEKFYPSSEMPKIEGILLRYLNLADGADKTRVTALFENLCDFHISDNAESHELTDLMRAQQPDPWQSVGLPTGLIAAGFLANVAMLPIDEMVTPLAADNGIAHFRYVDDHIILATSSVALVTWVREYQGLVARFHPGVRINAGKVEPTALAEFLKGEVNKTGGPLVGLANRDLDRTLEKARIDIRNPVPFLTSTIAKMSAIQRTEPLLLENKQLRRSIVDLEQFLLVDIPEQEIPKKSRVAFATSKLIHFFRAFTWEGTNHSDIEKEAVARLNRIVTAIHEFPGRKILWQKALRFCREFSITDLTLLKTEYTSLKKLNSAGTAQNLLAPYLLKLLGDELAVIRRLLEDSNRDEAEKLVALSYVASLLELVEFLQADIDGTYYSRKAGEYFSISCWLLLAASQVVPGSDSIRLRLLEKCTSIQKGSLRPLDTKFYEDPCLLSVVIYWVDQAFAQPGNLGPSPLWIQYLDQCRQSQAGWLRLAIRYPNSPHQRPLQLSKKQLLEVGAISNEAAHSIRRVRPRRHSATLRDVAMRRATWLIADPYDPRAGEWTALKWLEQIVERPEAETLLRHWSQVIISVRQPQGFAKPPDWHMWARDINLVHRASLAPPSDSTPLSDVERLRVAGLILLGLLRNSFNWPPSTYFPGAERDSGQALQKMILDVSASTRTTRILRACLIPQQLEPVSLKDMASATSLFDEEPIDGDTFYLKGFVDLRAELGEALRVLERGQMAVGDAKPRQLVPVNLFLLGHSLQGLDANDGGEGH
jgi:hypothetical protein